MFHNKKDCRDGVLKRTGIIRLARQVRPICIDGILFDYFDIIARKNFIVVLLPFQLFFTFTTLSITTGFTTIDSPLSQIQPQQGTKTNILKGSRPLLRCRRRLDSSYSNHNKAFPSTIIPWSATTPQNQTCLHHRWLVQPFVAWPSLLRAVRSWWRPLTLKTLLLRRCRLQWTSRKANLPAAPRLPVLPLPHRWMPVPVHACSCLLRGLGKAMPSAETPATKTTGAMEDLLLPDERKRSPLPCPTTPSTTTTVKVTMLPFRLQRRPPRPCPLPPLRLCRQSLAALLLDFLS